MNETKGKKEKKATSSGRFGNGVHIRLRTNISVYTYKMNR